MQTSLDSARSAVAAAAAGVQAAKEQLASNQTLTDGTTVAQHPNVLRSAARVREAYLALERDTLPAPVAGQVAKRGVQLGQRVAPGTPLMAIVPLNDLWIEANFKEVQLRQMRVNQPVTLEADLYGGKVEYHCHVVGLSAGTGSAFSLLPAQNATGNWIKVVQRVPVRIQCDPQQLADHPLRIGLSVVAKVDTSDQSGRELASVGRVDTAYHTQALRARHACGRRDHRSHHRGQSRRCETSVVEGRLIARVRDRSPRLSDAGLAAAGLPHPSPNACR